MWHEQEDLEDYSEYQKAETDILELREWQARAKKFYFENDNTAIFEVSTGAGKTFIAIDIIQELLYTKPDLKVLIVVPKNVILETGWYKELTDYGIPIQKIGVYYGAIKEVAQFTLTNIQSIKNLPMEVFDMILLDECHNVATDNLMQIIDHPFKYKLGLTATLKRLDNRHVHLLKYFNYNVFEYKPQQAIEDGVLNPFIFYNISVGLDEQTKDKYNELSFELNSIYHQYGSYERIMRTALPIKNKLLSVMNQRKQLINNYPLKFDVVFDIIKKHKDNKIIVFNQFNQQTSKLYWYLLETDIECRIVHSGISRDKREQAIIDFRNNKYNILLASKVLDEGVNLPKLDMAIIMAGDSTEKQTVQRVGRVLRKKKDKISTLIQIYCRGTFEERNSQERAKLFKNLSTDYKDIDYIEGQAINID